jgi:iron complex transport system substrate-binding protein
MKRAFIEINKNNHNQNKVVAIQSIRFDFVEKKIVSKLISSFLILFFINLTFLSFFACTSNDQKNNTGKIIGDTVNIKYAKGFRITQKHDTSIVEVINPWQNASNICFQYKLIKTDKAVKGQNDSYIHIPIKKVVCLSSTHVAFITALNELPSIKGISGVKNVYNPTICEAANKGKIFETGFENNLNFEKILQSNPDVVFAYGVGSESTGYIQKLEELGIHVILIGEYLEEHPLARAEWIKLFGVFFDKLDTAEIIFNNIDSSYQSWKQKASSFPDRPKIMTSLPWNGTWYISGSKTYMAKLIEDAGGDYLWKDINSNISLPIDYEKAFDRSKEADFWINIGQAKDKKYILAIDKRLSLLPAFKTGKLYNNVARIAPQGGNDYWESGTLNPNIILSDLVKIFHLHNQQDDSLFYYKKLK